jgi:hypothetical protein
MQIRTFDLPRSTMINSYCESTSLDSRSILVACVMAYLSRKSSPSPCIGFVTFEIVQKCLLEGSSPEAQQTGNGALPDTLPGFGHRAFGARVWPEMSFGLPEKGFGSSSEWLLLVCCIVKSYLSSGIVKSAKS